MFKIIQIYKEYKYANLKYFHCTHWIEVEITLLLTSLKKNLIIVPSLSEDLFTHTLFI